MIANHNQQIIKQKTHHHKSQIIATQIHLAPRAPLWRPSSAPASAHRCRPVPARHGQGLEDSTIQWLSGGDQQWLSDAKWWLTLPERWQGPQHGPGCIENPA